MKLRLISGTDIDRALTMAEAVDINARAYEALSSGVVNAPQRSVVETEKGVGLFMPAYIAPEGPLAVKIVSVFGDNPQKGLPVINGLVLVLDSETGIPRALMDGTRLTALRTGAGAGAAAKYLARPDSSIMAMFGAGGQAPDQIAAVLAVRPVNEVRIYSPSQKSADNLARKMSEKFSAVAFESRPSPAASIKDADIISCATTSVSPVFDPADVKPGAHINGVGSFKPAMREVQLAGLPSLRIFVDHRPAVLTEAGDIIQALNEKRIEAQDLIEIGDVISGRVQGRTASNQITFFKSVGVAAQDAAAAGAVFQKAIILGLGREVEI